jgi:hypothetical protein
MSVDRRDFLKVGLAAGATLAVSTSFPRFSWADVRSVRFADCMEMDAVAIADSSQLVTDSYRYLITTALGLKDKEIREKVLAILRNPAPTFAGELQDANNRQLVYQELQAKGLIKDVPLDSFLPPISDDNSSPFPFYVGPGSGYTSHHSYPGGLATHVAFNTRMAKSFCENYTRIYGYHLNEDVAVASEMLHDLTKPWVFQWTDSGSCRTEQPLAGTGEHHCYSVAESIKRGLPAEVCVAQACAHEHPGFPEQEKKVVSWLTTAALLIGKDPELLGLLAEDGKTLPQPRQMENFVCHLADHDWVVSVPAAKWLIPVMEKIAVKYYGLSEEDLKTRKFNQLRNYVFAQTSIMELYQVLSTRGEDALAYTVQAIVTPPRNLGA